MNFMDTATSLLRKVVPVAAILGAGAVVEGQTPTNNDFSFHSNTYNKDVKIHVDAARGGRLKIFADGSFVGMVQTSDGKNFQVLGGAAPAAELLQAAQQAFKPPEGAAQPDTAGATPTITPPPPPSGLPTKAELDAKRAEILRSMTGQQGGQPQGSSGPTTKDVTPNADGTYTVQTNALGPVTVRNDGAAFEWSNGNTAMSAVFVKHSAMGMIGLTVKGIGEGVITDMHGMKMPSSAKDWQIRAQRGDKKVTQSKSGIHDFGLGTAPATNGWKNISAQEFLVLQKTLDASIEFAKTNGTPLTLNAEATDSLKKIAANAPDTGSDIIPGQRGNHTRPGFPLARKENN